MKVQSKVSIFSMAFVVASTMGFASEANAGLFKRSDAKYLRDKEKKERDTRKQLEENGADRGVEFVARKSGKLLKTKIQINARRASMDAAAATAEAALNSTTTTIVTTTSPSNSSSSSAIDLSQSPLFVDAVNGQCPSGYVPMNDGSCGNTYFRQRGPCADESKGDLGQGKGDLGQGKGDLGQGKGDLGQGKGDLGQGKGDLGQGKGDLGQGKDPVCDDDEQLVIAEDGRKVCAPIPESTPGPVCKDDRKKCVPDEHKHVDQVTPVRTKTKKQETKKEETKKPPKKETAKKEQPKSSCTEKDPCEDRVNALKQEQAEKERLAQLERDRLQAEKDKAAAEAAKNKSDLEEALNRLAEIKQEKDNPNLVHVSFDVRTNEKDKEAKRGRFLGGIFNKKSKGHERKKGHVEGDVSPEQAKELIGNQYISNYRLKYNVDSTRVLTPAASADTSGPEAQTGGSAL